MLAGLLPALPSAYLAIHPCRTQPSRSRALPTARPPVVTVNGAAASTSVPARLDRLPWSRFHWRVVAALGITWVLDGLEVTLAGSVAPALQESPLLHLSDLEVGAAGSAYVAGAVLGALVFGQLADRLGRKRLFSVTLGVYLVSALLTALSWDFWSYAVFRALTGAGIGGEYS